MLACARANLGIFSNAENVCPKATGDFKSVVLKSRRESAHARKDVNLRMRKKKGQCQVGGWGWT